MKRTAKNLIALILCLSLLGGTAFFASCSKKSSNEKLTVLCTVFPIYDWVKNVTSGVDGVEVTLLVENGADLHSFQPSFSDMAKIKNSDVVIYVGGDSDKWVRDSVSDNALTVELSSADGITLYEPSKENIASPHEHEEHSGEHQGAFDEHIWLSVRNARVACESICQAMCEIDADNAQIYLNNTQNYTSKLQELDTKLREICADSTPIVFADRFPFIYLFEDYNVSYFAAFEGCSTDTDADFDTVIRLATKLDELQSKYVLVTENPTAGLAEKTIAESKNKNASIISLDSMQSLTAQSISDGATYVGIMTQNISALEQIFK